MKHLFEYDQFDDLDALKKDMQGLGLTLTPDEERMVNFLKSFGNDELAPSDFAEYLYDYYYNPEEYDIDEGGEYYDQISDYFDEISNCTRFNFGGPMGHGNYQRWNESCIRSSDVFKTYTKVVRMI